MSGAGEDHPVPDGQQDALARLQAQITDALAASGQSVTWLAGKSGLGRTTVSNVLNRAEIPSARTVAALARVLKLGAEGLLELRRQAEKGGGFRPKSAGAEPPAGPRWQASSAAAHTRGLRVRNEVLPFEERYCRFVAELHGKLTVVGLDLSHSGRAAWPLNAAYLSLEFAQPNDSWRMTGLHSGSPPVVRRAEQALAGNPRVLLKGLAGSGKSTLLQWLAVSAATESLPGELSDLQGRIPFVLPLRTLVRRGRLPQAEEFLSAVAPPLAALQPAGWADSVLSNRALVLVDGVDEVPRELRHSTSLWLRELLAAYKDLRVVVTTRPSAVPEGWLSQYGFTELTVQPMTAADTRVFISRWHTAARHNAASDEERTYLHQLETAMQTTVRSERDLSQLSTTPLMCALICALHRERRGHLPHGRMELYAAALSMLLVRRDHERGIDVPEGLQLTQQQSVRLLQRLAYWLIRNRQTEMSRGTALVLLADALPAMPSVAGQGDAESALAHLIGRTGLLRTPAVDTVEFVHRTFQDYLGAQAAIEGHDKPLLINHAHDDQWEDVIRMAVAHARPAEADELLLGLIQRGDREEQNRARLHLLSAASLHYATEVDPHIRGLVEERASGWLPPRSEEEADLLSALGPGILDLLPRTAEGLEADEAAAVLRTAASIGGDQAYGVLQQFTSTLPSGGLDTQAEYALSVGWKQFDAFEYARDILLPRLAASASHSVTVTTREQLDALTVLPPLRRVTFRGPFTAAEIAPHLSVEHASHLQIYEGDALDSVRFVRDFPLQELALSGCTQITHLKDLAGIQLPHLHLLHMADTFAFDALADLPALNRLALYTLLPWRDLRHLPARCELTELALGGNVAASIIGVSRYSRLQALTVNLELDEVEWEEIAALAHLTVLGLGENSLDNALPMLSIKHLSLVGRRSDIALHRIPDCFPNLETIHLGSWGWAPDIAPLQELQGVRITISGAQRVVGLDGFPPGTVILHPRPRLPPPPGTS
ncbi:NACHT domain-containing protein [Streptomyces sp. NPDC002602]|uniref:NACHT domain-containing protein n=1 Tax=Streptomyces sp. NPDC002602 TaxID=3364654 RepID=UPI0036C57055